MAVPVAGITFEEFLDLFVPWDESLPALRLTQDGRELGPDPDDQAFARHQGLSSGLMVWMAAMGEPIWRLVDIRTTFPSATRASAYHRETMDRQSEGFPPVIDAPALGDECAVFGGTFQIPQTPQRITSFIYLFRVHNVSVKLFVANGMMSRAGLSSELVARLGYHATQRILERTY